MGNDEALEGSPREDAQGQPVSIETLKDLVKLTEDNGQHMGRVVAHEVMNAFNEIMGPDDAPTEGGIVYQTGMRGQPGQRMVYVKNMRRRIRQVMLVEVMEADRPHEPEWGDYIYWSGFRPTRAHWARWGTFSGRFLSVSGLNNVNHPLTPIPRPEGQTDAEELEGLRWWYESHRNMQEVCDESSREAISLIEHLWPDWSRPGIRGICERLLLTHAQLATAEADLASIRNHMAQMSQSLIQTYGPCISCGYSDYHSADCIFAPIISEEDRRTLKERKAQAWKMAQAWVKASGVFDEESPRYSELEDLVTAAVRIGAGIYAPMTESFFDPDDSPESAEKAL